MPSFLSVRGLRPALEVIDRRLRTLRVVNLESLAELARILSRGAKRVGSLAGQQRIGRFVAVDARADEIAGRVMHIS